MNLSEVHQLDGYGAQVPEPHHIRERPLARQDVLPLQVRVDHGYGRLVLSHVAHHARHLGEPGDPDGPLAPVPAHEPVPACAQRPHRQRYEHAVRRDALRELPHLLVVGDAEGMARKRLQRVKGKEHDAFGALLLALCEVKRPSTVGSSMAAFFLVIRQHLLREAREDLGHLPSPS